MAPNPQEWLKQARQACSDGEFAKSLELYEYFFDNALAHSPSLTGVRLSYCLAYWADLGEQYPPALLRLEQRAQASLHQFEQTREPHWFHEFSAMCDSLNRPHEPIDRFVQLHATDPELAKRVVNMVWEGLIDEQRWDVCAVYIGYPAKRYRDALYKFDTTLALSRDRPMERAAELEGFAAEAYVYDVARLMLVLGETGHADAAAEIQRTALDDMDTRGRPELGARIGALAI